MYAHISSRDAWRSMSESKRKPASPGEKGNWHVRKRRETGMLEEKETEKRIIRKKEYTRNDEKTFSDAYNNNIYGCSYDFCDRGLRQKGSEG
jgi:hypothetical protein